MKFWIGIAVALIAGILSGAALSRLDLSHKLIARLIRGREPVAIVHGVGVYENDEARFADAELKYRARGEKISRGAVERELARLRMQFGEDKNWTAALRANHLCSWQLSHDIADHLRGRASLDRQLSGAISVSENECREYFAQHQPEFVQPIRYRAAHLFFAAPSGTPDEVVASKRRAIDELLRRLKQGESFVDLVATFSEDEATKKRGGDLGYFSAARMPPDFMAAVQALRVGDVSEVVQTKLGFHILRLTESLPERAMNFEEARAAIVAQLENAKRGEAVRKVVVDLARDAGFVRK